MTELLLMLCGLVAVVLGMLLITQMVSLELLGKGIWRCLFLLAFVLITLWLLKAVLLPILICALVWLKGVMIRTLVIVLAAVTLALLRRVFFIRLAIRNSSTNCDREES